MTRRSVSSSAPVRRARSVDARPRRLAALAGAFALLAAPATERSRAAGEVAPGSIVLDAANARVIVNGTAEADFVDIVPLDGGFFLVGLAYQDQSVSEVFGEAGITSILFSGGDGDDRITNGTAIRLEATGGAGNDVLAGGDGNDVLWGGPGDDELVGGSGDDLLLGEDGADTMLGGDGFDHLRGGAGDDLMAGGADSDVLLGDDGDDVLAGEDGADYLFGGAGADYMTAGAGADVLDGGPGDDSMHGGDGGDFLVGGTGNDMMGGDAGADVLLGEDDDDAMNGGLDDDLLAGGAGNDVMDGHDGVDVLLGDGGDDGLDGGFGDDLLFGGLGHDTLVGLAGADYLDGGEGDDFLLGAAGPDDLYGGGGDDRLMGDVDDFVLDGGGGINEVSTQRSSRLGIVANPANDPFNTTEDIIRALEQASTVAARASVFWGFRNQSQLADRLALVPVIAGLGLETFVQIGVQFLGEPNPPVGMKQTFADPAVRELFLENVRTIAETEPDAINLGLELNLLYWIDPDEFFLYATLYQEAFAEIKAISPDTQVGVSVLYALFFGYEQFEVLEALGPRDFIAITTYPIWILDHDVLGSIDEFPPQYWTWMRVQYPDDTIVVSETGFPNSLQSTPEEQAAYVRRLPELMAGLQPESINWILLTNVGFFSSDLVTEEAIEFLIELGVDPDLLFGRLNNMGLRAYDGTPMPAWFEAVKLDFEAARSEP